MLRLLRLQQCLRMLLRMYPYHNFVRARAINTHCTMVTLYTLFTYITSFTRVTHTTLFTRVTQFTAGFHSTHATHKTVFTHATQDLLRIYACGKLIYAGHAT